jgi:hypothetical protein
VLLSYAALSPHPEPPSFFASAKLVGHRVPARRALGLRVQSLAETPQLAADACESASETVSDREGQ